MTDQTDERAKLVINGKEYEFPSSYDLGEARMLKRLTGLYLVEVDQLRIDDPDWITFTVWVMLHREDPRVTVEDVERLDLDPFVDQIVAILSKAVDKGDAGPPAEAAGEPSETPGPSSGSAEPSPSSSTPTSLETTQETSGESG